ncbi:sensor domain-containing diguanylate cyclase [Brevibacillus sp. SYSU BS000544]|uniref:sensor domain-containing diguanylate cyclase n=1 Tax=Brevibacillus sp. SYSU BS000544 TaxID=3416443 RepID=UPI003CE46764
MMIKKMCCFCFKTSISSIDGDSHWDCPHCGKDITDLPSVPEEESFSEEYVKTILQYKEKSYQVDITIEQAQSNVLRAEAEIKRLNYQTQLILQAAGEGIFGLDPNGNVTFINSAALQILGFEQDELLGQNVYTKICQCHLIGTPSKMEQCPLYQASQRNIPQTRGQDVFWRKDRTTIPVEYVVTPILENDSVIGAVCVFKDISDRLRVEKQILEVKEQLESFISNTTDAIQVLDMEGKVLLVNTAYESIFGWKREELKGMHTPIIPQHLDYEFEEIRTKVIAGERLTDVETVRLNKDGSLIDVSVTISPIRDSFGAVVGIASVIRDIRERKRMEKELRESGRLLQGVAEASINLLTMTEDFTETIQRVLSILGYNASVDRVYVFENHLEPSSGDILVSQRFEWVRDSIQPQMGNSSLQNISYHKMGISRWYEQLSAGRPIVGLVKELPGNEKDLLISQNILSILVVPIFVRGQFWGFIGFDDCKKERIWSKNEEAGLIAAAASIGGAINRNRQEAMLKQDIEERIKVEQELAAANQSLQELSSIDGLTGIPNRRYFDENYQKEWYRSIRNQAPLSVILIDIDYFKEYNDTYGHQKGDECLKQVANIIDKTLRRPGDFAARYGGEEFIVVLPDTDLRGAAKIAIMICSLIEAAAIPHSQSQISSFVTISGGVASVIPDQETSLKSLIAIADKRLYEAKQNGRNQIVST